MADGIDNGSERVSTRVFVERIIDERARLHDMQLDD